MKEKDELSKEELIRVTPRAHGYKRLGKNLELVLAPGIQYAKSTDVIVYESDDKEVFSLNENAHDPLNS